MTEKIIAGAPSFIIISIISILLFSCENETIVRDADYPEQLIYLPAAYSNGQFVIDDITRKRGEQPIEGYLYKYIVDNDANRFIVPLSVYRAGVDNSGNFRVDIEVNNDTIAVLNEDRDLSDILYVIPEDKYAMVNSVEMRNGEGIARFDLNIDLDYLLDNYPDKLFALAVHISSDEREVNPDLSTAVVIIHSKIMKPTADFTLSLEGRKAFFDNNSLMASSYVWDFGDGYYSDEESPSHTYSSPGTYKATLTAVGITGNRDRSVESIEITVY
ncbi:MAG: PKD domain-containing protein [Parabacteroides sp.]|nr:PKD domain-containing protein [Parabacteroides sp.]